MRRNQSVNQRGFNEQNKMIQKIPQMIYMIRKKKSYTRRFSSCNPNEEHSKKTAKWKLNFKFIARTSTSTWLATSVLEKLHQFQIGFKGLRAFYSCYRSASFMSRMSVLLCVHFWLAIGCSVHIRFIINYRWKWDMWKIGNKIECTEQQWLCIMNRPKCVEEEDQNAGTTCY